MPPDGNSYEILPAHMSQTTLIIIGVALAVVIISGLIVMKVAKSDVSAIRNQFAELFKVFWFLWCLFRTLLWKLRFRLRHGVLETTTVVVLSASIFLLIEFALGPLRRLLEGGSLGPVPQLHGLPIEGELAVLALAALLVRHHFREWRQLRQRWSLPAAVKALLEKLEPVRAAPAPEKRNEFLKSLMDEVSTVLKSGKCGEIAATVMDKQSERWTVTYKFPPDTKLDDKVTLGVEEGGAGAAAKKGVVIYIPSTPHLVGIDMKDYETLGVTYTQVNKDDPFKSLICVPVYNDGKVTSVLNIASQKSRAFSLHDIGIGELAAGFVSALDAALKGK